MLCVYSPRKPHHLCPILNVVLLLRDDKSSKSSSIARFTMHGGCYILSFYFLYDSIIIHLIASSDHPLQVPHCHSREAHHFLLSPKHRSSSHHRTPGLLVITPNCTPSVRVCPTLTTPHCPSSNSKLKMIPTTTRTTTTTKLNTCLCLTGLVQGHAK
jgi:hypothetical protein